MSNLLIRCIYTLLVLLVRIKVTFPYLTFNSSSTKTSTNSSQNGNFPKQVYVIAGNFSLDGEMYNIAQYDVASDTWIKKYQAELYTVESSGIIFDVVSNRTSNDVVDKLYVVGTFDTMTSTSQMQFCSVGAWNGNAFEKVGEGLCPRGNSPVAMSTKILTITLGSKGDLFVGGNFESRIWDGDKFIKIQHVARFYGAKSSWLPLSEGSLTCIQAAQFPRVEALAWDEHNEILYIGGNFDSVDYMPLSTGLAIWSEDTGLIPFSTHGVFIDEMNNAGGAVSHLQYESQSQSLFVAGNFKYIGGIECPSVAVWHRKTNHWLCLYEPLKGISTVTTLLLSKKTLYVGGWVSTTADWRGVDYQAMYNIAVTSIAGYIAEKTINSGGYNKNNSGTSGNNDYNYNNAFNSFGKNISSNAVHGIYDSMLIVNDKMEFLREERFIHNDINNNTKLKRKSKSRRLYHPSLRSQQLVKQVDDTILHDNRERYINSKSNANMGSDIDTSYSPSPARSKVSLNTSKSVGIDNIDNYYGNNSNVVNSSLPSNSTTKPWRPEWYWLPGFAGGNGPIVRIIPGIYNLENCLFLVGAFNNYQAVSLWCDHAVSSIGNNVDNSVTKDKNNKIDKNKSGESIGNDVHGAIYLTGNHSTLPTVMAISNKSTIQGLVTSVTQVLLVDEFPTVYPTKPPSMYDNSEPVTIPVTGLLFMLSSFVILISAVIGLIVLRQNPEYIPVKDKDDLHPTGGLGANGDLSLNFPLTTLSGGIDHSVDFRASFERAMKARHLPSHEFLLIIDPSEVILSKVIGEGSFGRVYSGFWRNNVVAIKEFIFAQSAIVGGSIDRNNIIDEIVGEAGIMACLRHPKILQIYGCSLTMQAIWIASELCNRGSLRMVLNDRTVELTWLKKLSLCLDVADGMLYLHTRHPPIIHRDLKSHNIFIIETSSGNFTAKIGDWGSARALQLSGTKSMTHGVGTACWLAPECVMNALFSKDSDVYAFGILLWEVYTRSEVHERFSAAQIIAKVAHEGLRPQIPRFCPWSDLMSSCWHQNPKFRPHFNKILTELSAMYSKAKALSRNRERHLQLQQNKDSKPPTPQSTSPEIPVEVLSPNAFSSSKVTKKNNKNQLNLSVDTNEEVLLNYDPDPSSSRKHNSSPGLLTPSQRSNQGLTNLLDGADSLIDSSVAQQINKEQSKSTPFPFTNLLSTYIHTQTQSVPVSTVTSASNLVNLEAVDHNDISKNFDLNSAKTPDLNSYHIMSSSSLNYINSLYHENPNYLSSNELDGPKSMILHDYGRQHEHEDDNDSLDNTPK